MLQPPEQQDSKGGRAPPPPHKHTCPHPNASVLILLLILQIFFEMDQKKGSAVSGANWLCHPTAMQTYLSLLGSSQKDGTLEAACGALQNLTASGTRVSTEKRIIGLTVCVQY